MILKLKRKGVSYRIKGATLQDVANKLLIANFIPKETKATTAAIIQALESNGFNKIEFII